MGRIDHFITAAFGRYQGAGIRINAQARKHDIAHTSRFYQMADLVSEPAFWTMHGALMQSVPSGHFVWKPFVILNAMNAARDGEILMYCDAGCELNSQGRAQLDKWLELASECDLVLFSTGCNWEEYCKAVTTAHFAEQPVLRDVPHSVSANVLIIKVSPRTRQFMQQWYDLCGYAHYQLSDNGSYGMDEPPNFVAHRHDQSILHHLVLRSPLDIQVLEETLWRTDWRAAQDLPILAVRNRFQWSVLQSALQSNVDVLPIWKKIASKCTSDIQGMLR